MFAASPAGRVVFARGPDMNQIVFALLSRKGTLERLGIPARHHGQFMISPDGKKIAAREYVMNGSNIWIYDIQRRTETRLTTSGTNEAPVWMPDGLSVIYREATDQKVRVLRRTIDGLSVPDTISSNKNIWPEFVTPDGRFLGVVSSGSKGEVDVMYMGFERLDTLVPIAANPASTEVLSRPSRSGKYVAYTTGQTGKYEVYVQPFPPDGRAWNVTAGGGEEPVWSKDDRLLYYRNGDKLYEVDVTFGSKGLSFGKPRLIFAQPFENAWGYSYDVSPADGRLLILRGEVDLKPITSLDMITNFTALLEKP